MGILVKHNSAPRPPLRVRTVYPDKTCATFTKWMEHIAKELRLMAAAKTDQR